MDPGLLEVLKSVSPLQVIVIAGFVYWLLRRLRQDQKADVRGEIRMQLGLVDDEKFDVKLNAAVTAGFQASVHPLTIAVQGLTLAVAELRTEVKGLREATANHGERLSLLELEVASITAQVGGPTAVHAFRGRVERRKAELKGDPE